MKKTLYDTLSLSPNTPASLIPLAYNHLSAPLEPQVEMGHTEARQRLASMRMAHQILSDPTQREAYDRRLRDEEESGADHVVASAKKAANAPWNIVGLVLSVVLLGLTIGLYIQSSNAKTTLREQATAQASEREQWNREIVELQASLAAAEARASSLKVRLDDRHNQAFEQAVVSTTRSLDQQRQREEQAARQREAEERRQRQQAQERVAMQDARNAQSEKRYWACMNEALNRMTSDRANAQCARLR